MAVRVKREPPFVISKISQAAKMDRGITQTLGIFLSLLSKQKLSHSIIDRVLKEQATYDPVLP
jgi:hypothetical protein